MNIPAAITKVLYAVFGVVFLLAGATVLLSGTVLLPAALARVATAASHGDANTMHIIQEFGAFLVFAGLITLWFIRHYEQSRFFHWALTAAFALFALAHWFDARGTFESGIGPVVNSVPFILFALTGLLRLSAKERA